MHQTFDFHRITDNMDPDTLKKMWEFRTSMLDEEIEELKDAKTPEDALDALIDLCVFAIGTIDLYVTAGVGQEAWDKVMDANMAKERGVKPGRPNPFGLPDLLKPEGWVAPDLSELPMSHLDKVYDVEVGGVQSSRH